MKALPVLLFLMLQIANNNDGSVRKELNLSLEQLYGIACENSFAAIEVGLSGNELLMIGLCFVLALIHRKRRNMNENIRKRIKILQKDYYSHCDSDIPQAIGSTLEDYRSKNSCLEFPMRKMDRECDRMVKEVEQKFRETEIIYNEFRHFTEEFNQAVLVPESVMDVNDLRVKVELVALKKFITSEVSVIKVVQDYYKDLIGDAVEEVDRVISAEGL